VNRDSIAVGLTVVAAVLGVVAIVTRPFLFAPLGVICLCVAAVMSSNRRLTVPVAVFLAVGALAGAAIAVGFTKPLY
jgi:hypothetical protein